MQDNLIQPAVQPFLKLAQANMELFTKFSMSPEVVSQAMADAQKLFQQFQGSAMNLSQSDAFAQLMQGLMKNYTEFATDLAQSGMALMSQAQAALMRQAQDATSNVVDAAQERVRRTRHAA
jgi:uncharacterized membrane-anchored protein YhcB (DUF1043 family)